MKPEFQYQNGAMGATYDAASECDPYLIAIVNECQEEASLLRSENIVVVVDELDSTALRRRTDWLPSAHRS